jgi:tetratricopeptide (TPR) repeat protein
VTDQLHAVLSARLNAVSPDGLKVLEAVAVLDRHASIHAVAGMTGVSARRGLQWAGELSENGILITGENGLAFRHDILKEFAYESMGELRRAALHLAAGEVLAREGSPSNVSLANHFAQAGDRARAFEYAMRAARKALSSAAYSEAATMAALAESSAGTSEASLKALDLRGTAELAAGSYRLACSHFEGALLLIRSDDVECRVRTKLRIARCQLESSEWEKASLALDEAEEAIAEHAADDSMFEVSMEARALRLKLAILTNDEPAARVADGRIRAKCGNEGASVAAAPSVVEALCESAVFALFFDSTKDARKLLADLTESNDSLPLQLRQKVLLSHAMVCLREGEWEEAQAVLRDGVEAARRANDLLYFAHLTNSLACLALEQGYWHRAEEYCEQCLELDESLLLERHLSLPPLVNKANVYFYRGEPRPARRLYSRALQICEADRGGPLSAELHSCLGLIALQLDEHSVAEEHWRLLLEEQQGVYGIQERFKIEWFRAAIDTGIGSRKTARRLTTASEQELPRDYIGHLKLRWLAAQLGGNYSPTPPQVVSRLLAESGIGWFGRFTSRWNRIVGQ